MLRPSNQVRRHPGHFFGRRRRRDQKRLLIDHEVRGTRRHPRLEILERRELLAVVYNANEAFLANELSTNETSSTFAAFSLGYSDDTPSGFSPFLADQHSNGAFDEANLQGFLAADFGIAVINVSDQPLMTPGDGITVGQSQILLHPGRLWNAAIVRFTAPDSGMYSIAGEWESLAFGATQNLVIHNGLPLFSSTDDNSSFDLTTQLAAGDTVDFAVRPSGDSVGDATGLRAIVSYETVSIEIDDVTPNPRTTPVNAVGVTLASESVPASFDREDVILSRDGGPNLVTSSVVITPVSPTRFVIIGLESVTGEEGDYRLEVDGNGITKTGGNAVGGRAVTEWALDTTFAPLDHPFAPVGSLVYSGIEYRSLEEAPNDLQRLTVDVDAGQTIAVIVKSSENLRTSVELADPASTVLGFALAASPGETLVLQTLPASSAGSYALNVAALDGTTGDIEIQVILNAAVEDEQHGGATNDAPASAQDLEAAMISLGVGTAERAAVLGRVGDGDDVVPIDTHDYYSFALAAGQSASLATNGAPLELYDSEHNRLAVSSRDENGNQLINNFVAPEAGNYYAVISNLFGPADYNLVVTRDADFDTETNNRQATAQTLSGANTALGSVGVAQSTPGYGSSGSNFRMAGDQFQPFTGLLDEVAIWDVALDTSDVQAIVTAALTGPAGQFAQAVGQSGPLGYWRFDELDGDTAVNFGSAGPTLDATYFGGQRGAAGPDQTAGLLLPGFESTNRAFRSVPELPGFVDVPASPLDNVSEFTIGGWMKNESATSFETILQQAGVVQLSYYDDFGTPSIQISTNNNGFANFAISQQHLGQWIYLTAVGDGERLRLYVNGQEQTPVLDFSFPVPGPVAGRDVYEFSVNAGDLLTIETRTPAGDPQQTLEFKNQLDPVLELFDPNGIRVAVDDNSGTDAKNARLTHAALESGVYRVRVAGENVTAGEYVVHVDGATGSMPDFSVAGTNISDGSRIGGVGQVIVDFNDAILLSSLQASDLTVGGLPALGFTVVDADTVWFELPDLPEGTTQLAIPEGAILDLQGTRLTALALEFYNDITPPRVVESSIQEGDVVLAGDLTMTFEFSEPIRQEFVTPFGFQLTNSSGLFYQQDSFQFDASGTSLTLSYRGLPEDHYSLLLRSLEFSDLAWLILDGEPLAFPIPPNQSGDGVQGGDFVVNFSTDITVTPFPTPLQARSPLGSLVYESSTMALIGPAGDTDSFILNVDPGQTLTVVVNPDSGLRPRVSVDRVIAGVPVLAGSADSPAVGQDAVLSSMVTTGSLSGGTPTTYQITVGGLDDTGGRYQLRAILNAAVEQENHGAAANGSLATAQDIDDDFINLGDSAQHASVLGKVGAELLAVDRHQGSLLRYNADGELHSSTQLSIEDGFVFGMYDLDVDPTSNLAYAIVDLFTNQLGSLQGALVTLDIQTGEVTYIASLTGERFSDMAFASSGNLYGLTGSQGSDPESLFGIDKLTGEITLLRTLSTASPNGGESLALNSDDGRLYRFQSGQFQSIDPSNQFAVTRIPVTGIQVDRARALTYAGNGQFLLAGGDNELYSITLNGQVQWITHFKDSSNISGLTTLGDLDDRRDLFSFTLQSDHTVSLAVNGSGVGLRLIDSSGTALAVGSGDTKNFSQLIQSFQSLQSGSYYVEVTGLASAEYTLMVSRNAELDTGNNISVDSAQGLSGSAISGQHWALGHVRGGNRLFGVPLFTNEIVELDPITGAEINRIPSPGGFNAGSGAEGLAFNGTNLFYANATGNLLWKIDPDTGQVIDAIPGFQSTPGVAALGGKVYLLNYPQSDIVEFDPNSNTVTNVLDIDAINPGTFLTFGLAGISGPDALLATNRFDGEIVEIDPATGLVVNSLTTSLAVLGLAVTGGEIHVGTLYDSRIDVFSRDGVFQRSLPTGFFDGFGALGGDDAPASGDFYRIGAASGAAIIVETSAPAHDWGEFVNLLDPMVRLYGPDGSLLMSDDNSAADGFNAMLSYVVPTNAGGTYYVEVVPSDAVSNSAGGEYIVAITGGSPEPLAFGVAAISVADGERVRGQLGHLTVDFGDNVLLTTLDASDLTVSGVPATDLTIIDGNTVRFELPLVGEGIQNIQIAAGAITDLRGTPIREFNRSFYHDITAPRVIRSSVQQGDVVSADLDIEIEFDEPMRVENLDASDIQLIDNFTGSMFQPTAFGFDATGTVLSLQYDSLSDSDYVLRLFSGDGQLEDLAGIDLDGEPLAFPIPNNQSGDGGEGGDFFVTFKSDHENSPLPTPLTRIPPFGSLVYYAEATGSLQFEGDTDSYTIDLDKGQTITVVAEPGPLLGLVRWEESDGGSGHWYGVTRNAASSIAAEFLANQFGGHLVSINSAEEQAFIDANFLSGADRFMSYLIGATDRSVEGEFRWTSGEALTYTNWHDGEPNDLFGLPPGEDYSAINGFAGSQGVFGTWNDVSEFDLGFGLIELPSVPQLELNLSRDGKPLASSVAAAAGEQAFLQTVPVGKGGVFSITVGGTDAAIGSYRLRVILNSAIETEPILGVSNDEIASAQSIDDAFLTVIGNAQRAAVVGNVGPQLFAVTRNTGELLIIDSDGQISSSLPLTIDGNAVTAALDLIVDPTGGDVFAVVAFNDGAQLVEGVLVRVELETGQATLVDDVNPGSERFSDLALDAAGTLYGVTDGSSTNPFALFAINTTDGSLTLLTTLADNGFGSDQGLAFNPDDGLLYRLQSGRFESIDPASDFLVSEIPTSVFVQPQSLTYVGGGRFLLSSFNTLYSVSTAGEIQGLLGINSFAAIDGLAQLGGESADTYSLTFRAGQNSTIGLSGFLGQVEVLDHTGSVLARGTPAENLDSVIGNFIAPSTGAYYLRVTRGLVGDYQLVVTRNLQFDTEPNRLGIAQPIVSNQSGRPARVLGYLHGFDSDVFQVELSAGRTVTIWTETPGRAPGEFSNELNPMLRLYDASYNLVASDDDSARDGINARLSYRVPSDAAGTYYIEVRPLQIEDVGGLPGEYVLSVLGAKTLNPRDVNDDGRVSALDALTIINALRRREFRLTEDLMRLDANGDGIVSSRDALYVINSLPKIAAADWASAVDSAMLDDDDEEHDLLVLLADDRASIAL